MTDTPPPDAPLTDEQRDEWSHALQYIHEDDRTVLEYARTWADSWSVDYDEGPCAIEFKKGGASYWYLIDDIGWDADDPRTELIVELLTEREALSSTVVALRTECERLRAQLDHLVTQSGDDSCADVLRKANEECDTLRKLGNDNASIAFQRQHEVDRLRALLGEACDIGDRAINEVTHPTSRRELARIRAEATSKEGR